jgi:1,4-dihydroxy-2-naphthoyl-CoA synthase
MVVMLFVLVTLNISPRCRLQAALRREAEAQALTYATDDLCEGVLAVKQKRKPNFTGN